MNGDKITGFLAVHERAISWLPRMHLSDIPRALPGFARMVKEATKTVLRALIYWRLDRLPLLPEQAATWGERFLKWPAIFGPWPYRRVKRLGNGSYMSLGLVDVIERSLFVDGAWDQHVMRAMQEILRPGSVFIDVGANIGYFSLAAARLVGEDGLVLAFEPSIRALQRLAINLGLNQDSKIALLSAAIGDSPGLAKLYLSNPSNTGGTTLLPREWANHELAISLRLDDIVDSTGIVPSLIKIDVEGLEFHVLKGAERLLKAHAPYVICEVTGYFIGASGLSASDLLSFMAQLGYKAVSLTAAEFGDSQLLKCLDGQDDILFIPPDDQRLY